MAFGERDAEELQRELDVLGGGERRQQMEELENGADLFAAQEVERLGVEVVDASAEEADLAGVGAIHAAETVEERGFSGAGGTGERDAFAGSYVEGDGVEHQPRAVGFGNGGDGEGGEGRQDGGGGGHGR